MAYGDGPELYAQASWTLSSEGPTELTIESLGRSHRDAIPGTGTETEHRFTMSYTEPSPALAKIAFLSWGYLAYFATFGYGGVLSPSFRSIRSVLLSGDPRPLGEAYYVAVDGEDDPIGPPIALALFVRKPANRIDFAGIGFGMGRSIVVFPAAADVMGEIYRTMTVLERRRFEQLAILPFFGWALTQGRTSFLGESCELWFRDLEGERRRLVGVDVDTRVAELGAFFVPGSRAPRSRRRSRRKDGPVIHVKINARNLETDLDSGSWLARAQQALAEWLAGAGVVDPASGSGAEDEAAFMARARKVAPPFLVSHFEDMRLRFGQGIRRPGPTTEQITDLVEVEARRLGVEIGDLHVIEEAIDDGNFIRAYTYGFLAGRPVFVGPFYTTRTLKEAVLAELAARRGRPGAATIAESQFPLTRKTTVQAIRRPKTG